MAPTAYEVEGSLLEACSCGAPCPCWVGEDPHGGTCDAFLAYRIDRGRIREKTDASDMVGIPQPSLPTDGASHRAVKRIAHPRPHDE